MLEIVTIGEPVLKEMLPDRMVSVSPPIENGEEVVADRRLIVLSPSSVVAVPLVKPVPNKTSAVLVAEKSGTVFQLTASVQAAVVPPPIHV